jgi:hypothetical protein
MPPKRANESKKTTFSERGQKFSENQLGQASHLDKENHLI